MSGEGDLTREARFEVEFKGVLPYHVPVPDRAELRPSRVGAPPFRLWFEHFQPPHAPGAAHGESVDDHRGTFIRSRVIVLFTLSESPDETAVEKFAKEALVLTNKALLSIKYAAADHRIRHVAQFMECQTDVWRIHTDGAREHVGGEMTVDFGPHGLSLQATLNEAGQEMVWWLFNDVLRFNAAWLLVLDAKYHLEVGDIAHALFDIGTALEIHVETLLEWHTAVAPALAEIDIDGVPIHRMYDEILKSATDHSLHERPDLFINLEYIRELRNAIAHQWKPEFRIHPKRLERSRYVIEHRNRDGHVVNNRAEVEQIIEDAIEIMTHVTSLFEQKHGAI